MVVYEVTCSVMREVGPAFKTWIARHVHEVSSLEGFVEGRWAEVVDPVDAERRVFLAWYGLADQAALERYLAEDAPRMRADGLRRFGDRFTATPRVLVGGD